MALFADESGERKSLETVWRERPEQWETMVMPWLGKDYSCFVFLSMDFLLDLNPRFSISVQRRTGVPQGFLKHAMPDYLVRGVASFLLRLSSKNNSHPTWIRYIEANTVYFVYIPQNFSNYFMRATGWNRLTIADLNNCKRRFVRITTEPLYCLVGPLVRLTFTSQSEFINWSVFFYVVFNFIFCAYNYYLTSE